jgi:hypothetical protein
LGRRFIDFDFLLNFGRGGYYIAQGKAISCAGIQAANAAHHTLIRQTGVYGNEKIAYR